jgi:cell filamentation protein
MTFDLFRDFDSRGYLHNFAENKNILEVKALEHVSFLGNIERAMNKLEKIEFIEYKHILNIHKILFGDVIEVTKRSEVTR